MENQKNALILNLQLFGEGAEGAADGGTGTDAQTGVKATAAVPQTKGRKSNPLSSVKYGIQEEVQPAAEVEKKKAEGEVKAKKATAAERQAEYEKLIKGDYKDLYNKEIQNIVQQRLKSTNETVDKYNAMAPMLEMLSKKYGVDATDIDALSKAIADDDSYYQEEAMERGISVEELKNMRKIERENEALNKRIAEIDKQENARKRYADWIRQAEELKGIYPSFDIEAEIENKQFADLLRANIPVRTAYEVVHRDEIIGGAMQFAAKTAEKKVTNKIKANAGRPSENGMNAQGAAEVKSDVSQLTKADRQEIARRALRGEKIRFS